MRRGAALVTGVLCACAGTRGDGPPTSVPEAEGSARPSPAPHVAPIASVALAPDGAAALTVDQRGTVRLWPTLDGFQEPLALPLAGARQTSLARAGDGSFTIAAVDAAGTGRIASVTTQRMTVRAELAPTPPLRSLEVLAGGERILALGSDHVIRLLDRDGHEQARLERRGFRPARLCPAEAGDAFLAVGAESVRRVRVEDRSLVPDAAEIVPKARIALEHTACSPDGRRLAYLIERVPKGSLVVLGPGGEERRHEVPNGPAALCFLSDEHVVWLPAGVSPLLFSKTGPAPTLRLTAEAPIAVSAFARGHWVAAVGGGLRIAVVLPDGSIPDAPLTIGYDAVATGAAMALSPSGRSLAWTSSTGDVYVDEVGSAEPPRRLHAAARWAVTRALFGGGAHPLAVGFVDEDRLAVGYDDGSLAMLAVAGGERLFGVVAPGPSVKRVVIAEGLVYHALYGQDAVVYEVDPVRGFVGPHLFGAEGRDWVGVGGAGDERVVWRVDEADGLKVCTLTELRTNACLGRPVAAPNPAARVYVIDVDGGRWEQHQGKGLLERTGATPLRLGIGTRALSSLTIGPRPDVVLAGYDSAVVALEVASGATRWSVASSTAPALSADGARAAVSVGGGVAVLEVATGAVLHRRCATAFGRSDAVASQTFQSAAETSLCE